MVNDIYRDSGILIIFKNTIYLGLQIMLCLNQCVLYIVENCFDITLIVEEYYKVFTLCYDCVLEDRRVCFAQCTYTTRTVRAVLVLNVQINFFQFFISFSFFERFTTVFLISLPYLYCKMCDNFIIWSRERKEERKDNRRQILHHDL